MKTILSILLLIIVNSVNAQQSIVTIDSLRKHFKKDLPFEVYDYYYNRSPRTPPFDYKSFYYDKEMEDNLMKWLNPSVWINYNAFLDKINLLEKFEYDSDAKNSWVKAYIINELKLNYDSIHSDTLLLNKYFIESIKSYEEKSRDRLMKANPFILPPKDVLYLHSKIAYPESYFKIKDWWYKNNKPTLEGTCKFNSLFYYLLTINDPEAQQILNSLINNAVKRKDDKMLNHCFIRNIADLGNAYSLKKLTEILSIKKKVAGLASQDGTSYIPLDEFTFEEIKQIFYIHNLNISYFSHDVEINRKNKSKIIEVAERLIKKLEAEEQYWMKNIPYDYAPDVQSGDGNQTK
jgi:hypothetical protein